MQFLNLAKEEISSKDAIESTKQVTDDDKKLVKTNLFNTTYLIVIFFLFSF